MFLCLWSCKVVHFTRHLYRGCWPSCLAPSHLAHVVYAMSHQCNCINVVITLPPLHLSAGIISFHPRTRYLIPTANPELSWDAFSHSPGEDAFPCRSPSWGNVITQTTCIFLMALALFLQSAGHSQACFFVVCFSSLKEFERWVQV